MKRFFVKCLLLVLILGVVLHMGGWAYQHTPAYQRLEMNDYPWDYKDMPESVETAIFGASHAVYGFMALTASQETAFSFALSAQTPQYDWMLMRQYQDRLSQDALVVLTVSYVSPFWTDTAQQFQEKQDRYYSILMPWNIVDVDLSKWGLERVSPLLTTGLEEVVTAFREAPPQTPLTNPYWEFSTNGCLEADRVPEELEIVYGRHRAMVEPVFPDVNPVMWEAYHNMLSLCEERGWKAVLVEPPYTAAYNDCFSQEFYDTFHQLLAELSAEFQVPYLDYSHDPQFTGDLSLFVDVDHLNFAGSQLLQQKFEADLAGLGLT